MDGFFACHGKRMKLYFFCGEALIYGIGILHVGVSRTLVHIIFSTISRSHVTVDTKQERTGMMDCNLHERRCSWLVLQVLGILILMVILPTDAMIAKMPISQTSSSKLMYSHLKSNVSNTMTIGQTPFLPGKKPSIHRPHNVQAQVQVHFQKRIAWSQAHAKRDNTLTMLRNFDLPEAIIFYGMDTFVVPASITNKEKTLLQPGVERLLKEAQEIDTSVILLSESKTEVQIQEFLQQQPFYDSISAFNLQIRSSLDMLDPSKFLGRGMGHAPCPAALLDAISSVEIHPKGFGGSSGFGTKQAVSTVQCIAVQCTLVKL